MWARPASLNVINCVLFLNLVSVSVTWSRVAALPPILGSVDRSVRCAVHFGFGCANGKSFKNSLCTPSFSGRWHVLLLFHILFAGKDTAYVLAKLGR